jgi:hypothetical protein
MLMLPKQKKRYNHSIKLIKLFQFFEIKTSVSRAVWEALPEKLHISHYPISHNLIHLFPGGYTRIRFIYTTYIYQIYKGLIMAETHPLENVLDRLTVMGAIIAVATLWNTLWNPWKDIAASVGLSTGWEVFIFLGPLVIILVLSLWWVTTQ